MLSTSITVIIADDHEIFRMGLVKMVESLSKVKVVAEAGNGVQLLNQAIELKPDVVISDIDMPEMNGIQVATQVLKKNPATGFIFLTIYDEEEVVTAGLKTGALSFLNKSAGADIIESAIEAVYKGEAYFKNLDTARLFKQINSGLDRLELTDKELAIIELTCKEMNRSQIAKALGISMRSVEGYKLRLYEKLNVKNSAGLVLYALRKGLFRFKTK